MSPPLDFLIQEVWDGVWEFAFMSFPVSADATCLGLHFENH